MCLYALTTCGHAELADGILGDLLQDLDQGIISELLDSLWWSLAELNAPIHNITWVLNWT